MIEATLRTSAAGLRRAQQAAENKGSFIPAAVIFAIRWAVTIEMTTDKGVEVGEIAAATRKKVNIEKLSGAPYEYAVFFLGQHWIFGESLKKWHMADHLPKPKGYDNLLLDIGVPIF
ncbi:MAG: hypothetical protein Q8L10_00710 [Candidatus Moranbacteria bacterium]|nr:hypothetical protein [Candidatus Moranbacteria bacterium]